MIAALLVADGRATTLSSPTWAAVACALALTLGTALGGWRIVRTIGRGIVRLHPLDGVAGQGGSAGVIVAASALGAPVSTTQVVASTVVGVGGGRHRWRHVHWAVVREMALGWVVTLPVTRRAGGRRAGALGGVGMRWFLPETPDVLGLLRAPARGDDRGHGRVRRLGGR